MKIDKVELERRWTNSWQAWLPEIEKFTIIDAWYTAFEKHMETGDDWNETFRFPELFGAVERKYDNLVEYLPEMRVKGSSDSSIAEQAAYDHQVRKSNLQREKQRALKDAARGGLGCIFVAPVHFEKTVKTENGEEVKVFYDGLGGERVDPRDIIPAYSALVLHDHTGQSFCPYLFRRRTFFYNTFLSKYDNDVFNQSVVKEIQPTSFNGGFSAERNPSKMESVQKTTDTSYVTVLEYWDQENDILEVYANDWDHKIFESPTGIPYSHKQLPFHLYYDYRREDSISGLGEIELNMPYNVFREQVLNLGIENLKLELQPAWIADGNINFNTEEAELEPGAIFKVSGLTGGRLEDHIMPFRSGGITGDLGGMLNLIEDSRIVNTGDDTRSLYANPEQLATQTLAKREAMQKRIRSNIIRNTIESEFYLANQIVSYLKHELAKPYEENGEVKYREVAISGFEPIQDKKEGKVRFEKIYGAAGKFALNPKVAKDFDNEIEIVPIKLDEEIKRDRLEKLMIFMQEVIRAASVNPQILQGMSMSEFLKAVTKEMGLDVSQIFPAIQPDMSQVDIINTEHDQIAMGFTPEIKPDEDSMEHYMAHIEFERSSVYKKLSERAKDAMKKHKILTLKNVQSQTENAGKPTEGGVGVPMSPSERGPSPSPIQPMGEETQSGTEGLSPSAFKRGVQQREAQRPA